LIDSDEAAHPADLLRTWRENAELSAAIAISERGRLPSSAEGYCYEAERLMPALIREMRDDVQSDDTQVVRKFLVKPSPGVVVSSVGEIFEYNRAAHPHVYNQVALLEQMGLVTQDGFDPTVPRYRLSPEFHRWLRETETSSAAE
jgi:hypothetical protein